MDINEEKSNLMETIHTALADRWELKKRDKYNKSNYKEYNEEVYFYKSVRKAMHTYKGDHKPITLEYEHKCYNNKNKTYYTINVRKNKKYKLQIRNIKFKIYEGKIGIITFNLLNNRYKDRDEILEINEYGRRIYPQHIQSDNNIPHFLSEKIILSKQCNIEKFTTDYHKVNINRISQMIMCLLGDKFSVDEPIESMKDKIVINPIIDDRMFVMCHYYSDDEASNVKYGLKNYENKDYWCRYLFVDTNYSSCKNDEMKDKIIKNHTYYRWSDYGTLYGITRYSYMIITDESSFSKTLGIHFHTMYYEMVCLVLAQRACILAYSESLSKIDLEKDTAKKLEDLYKSYLESRKNLYFREVTAQEQGIELYKMLLENMEIDRDIDKLKEEIDEIYQYVRLQEEAKNNENISKITNLGAMFIIPNFIVCFLALIDKPLFYICRIGGVLLVILSLITKWWLKINKNKDAKLNNILNGLIGIGFFISLIGILG
jgi:hypothetical protein